MERQRREEEVKHKSSKKGQEAEQSILNRVFVLFCFKLQKINIIFDFLSFFHVMFTISILLFIFPFSLSLILFWVRQLVLKPVVNKVVEA